MTTATRTIRIVIDSANANRQIDAVTQKTNAATFATNKLASAIGGIVSAYAAVNAVKAIATIGDEYAKITGLLRNATSSQEEFNTALAESKRIAEATRSSLSSTVETFAALSRATDGSGRSQQELFGILETINKSIALTSPNAESAAAALTQFGQALGGDFKAGAQELNSILEQAPGLAEAVARGLGVATKDLKTMGAEGELSAEKILNALQDVANDVDARFEKIPKTVSGTLTQIKNDIVSTFGEEDVAGPLIGSLEELKTTLNDPATKQGLVTLASALVTIAGWAAKLAVSFTDAGKQLGYFLAVATGNISELDKLEKKLKDVEASIGKGFFGSKVAGFFSDEQLKDQATQLRLQISEIQQLMGGTGASAPLPTESKAPEVNFRTPEITAPDVKVDKLLEAGYRAEEKLAEQHYQNMKDIESEFWDSVDAEGRASDQIEEAQGVTESMKLELASRLQVAQFYRDANLAGIEGSYEREAALLNASAEEKRAQVDQRWAEDSQKRADQEAEALIQIGVNLQARAEIMAAYDEQERVAKEIHTAELTAIEEAAAERRRQLDEAEANRKMKLGFDIGKASLAALQTFGSQSEKTQKRLAKVSIAVDTAQGVAAGVKLGWPLGIPAVLWAVINGAKAMSALNSAGSISPASAGSIPSMPTTATSNEPKFEQKRVIEIKGAIDGSSLVKVSDLPEIFGNTDTVVLLAGAQAEAQRKGVI